MSSTSTCDQEVTLERAFTDGEPGAREHAQSCAACGARWRALEELRALARSLPTPLLTAERREAMRAALVGAVADADDGRGSQLSPARRGALRAALVGAAPEVASTHRDGIRAALVGDAPREAASVDPVGTAEAVPASDLVDRLQRRVDAASARPGSAGERSPRARRGRWTAGTLVLATTLACGAAALALYAVWRPAATEGAPDAIGDVEVHPQGPAAFARVDAELVRLSEGTLTFVVPPRPAGQRFRVVTGDGEVEVVGTAFDAVARADRLESVRVFRGRVSVLVPPASPLELAAGQTWHRPAEPSREAARPSAAVAAAQTLGTHEPPVVAGSAVGGAVESPAGAVGAPPDAHRRPVAAGADRAAPGEPPPARTRVRASAESARAPVATPGETPPAPASLAAAAVRDPEVDPDLGRPGEAAAQAGRAVEGDAESEWRSAWAAWRRGDSAAAVTGFAAVRAAAPSGALAEDATFWEAAALTRAGRVEDAHRAWAAFLRAFPASSLVGEAHLKLGTLLLDAGRADEAAGHFERASKDRSATVRAAALEGLSAAKGSARP